MIGGKTVSCGRSEAFKVGSTVSHLRQAVLMHMLGSMLSLPMAVNTAMSASLLVPGFCAVH